MNAPRTASQPTDDTTFAPAAFAARRHTFRAVAFVTAIYFGMLACAPWLITEGPQVAPTPQVLAAHLLPVDTLPPSMER